MRIEYILSAPNILAVFNEMQIFGYCRFAEILHMCANKMLCTILSLYLWATFAPGGAGGARSRVPTARGRWRTRRLVGKGGREEKG